MLRLAFAFLLSFCVSAQAQLNGGGTGFPGPGMPAATAGCSEATTFLARTTGLDATHQTAYTTLICGLVTDSLWTNIDALWILATQDATTAGLNLKSTSFTLTPTNAPTFTADQGYTGNGTTQCLNTGFSPASSGTAYTQNGASVSAYIRTSRTTSNTFNILGTNPTSGTTVFFISPLQSSQFQWSLNGTTFPNAANANAQGFWQVSRTASNAMTVFKNGASFTTNTGASGVLTNMTNTVKLLSNSSAVGACNSFSTDQLAAAHIGGSMSTTDLANLSNRINAFMTTVGANVY